jgi:hypothetical protein
MRRLVPVLAALAAAFAALASCGRGRPDAAALMRGPDGIPGWTRTDPAETFNREGLYGYIDGGAEIVLPYGFLELSVSRYRPANGGEKEITLEIYRMATGEGAFGLYSTKLEGGETPAPGVLSDSWIVPGQAALVKGPFTVDVLGPDCGEDEIAAFAAAVERLVPGAGTVRPAGLGRLPRDGMVPSSARFVKGAVAAANESPFLEGEAWGFGGSGAGGGPTAPTVAYTAKYAAASGVSKLALVELAAAPPDGALEEAVGAAFRYYLKDVLVTDGIIEGRNEAGRLFLFGRRDAFAALVLGEPDEAAARARLEAALSPSAAGAAPRR